MGKQSLDARYYDPGTGEFSTVDTDLSETDQPYIYAGDDPVNQSDPSGLCYGTPFGCIGGGPDKSHPYSCGGSTCVYVNGAWLTVNSDFFNAVGAASSTGWQGGLPVEVLEGYYNEIISPQAGSQAISYLEGLNVPYMVEHGLTSTGCKDFSNNALAFACEVVALEGSAINGPVWVYDRFRQRPLLNDNLAYYTWQIQGLNKVSFELNVAAELGYEGIKEGIAPGSGIWGLWKAIHGVGVTGYASGASYLSGCPVSSVLA